MTETLKQARSKWWRFSQYEIKDGHIRPAPGARLDEYDPWTDYERCRVKGTQPPYQSLLELCDGIRHSFAGATVSDETKQRILAWTAEHGLVGILPQQTIVMHCAPRQSPLSESQFECVQPVFLRVGGRFMNQDIYTENRAAYDEEVIHFPFDSLEESSIRRDKVACVAQFFLDAKPHPVLSPEFWKNYVEPIWDWTMAVHALSLAIRKCDDYYLNLIFSSVGSSVRFHGANAQLMVNYPSLLSAFAAMFIQDSISGFRVIKCAGCGIDVITSAYQTVYCSRTCGDRDRKRRSRAAALRVKRPVPNKEKRKA